MSPAIRTEKDPGLRADALGLVESVIMGVAGRGPAYSVAVSTATLIAAVRGPPFRERGDRSRRKGKAVPWRVTSIVRAFDRHQAAGLALIGAALL
jgi:hypothetical protein